MNRLTFATWVKRDIITKKQNMIMSADNGGWGVYFSETTGSPIKVGDNNYVWFTLRGANCWHSDAEIADTQWHFVAVTLDNNIVNFYIDGKPAGRAAMAYAINSGSGGYCLGGTLNDPRLNFMGCLGNTLIFDRPLGASEIAKLYGRTSGAQGAGKMAGLVAGYHLDEGRGTTAHDFSGHGNDGTLKGGVRFRLRAGRVGPACRPGPFGRPGRLLAAFGQRHRQQRRRPGSDAARRRGLCPGARRSSPRPARRQREVRRARPGRCGLRFRIRDFTIQVWANYRDASPEQVLIEKFSGTDGPGWTLTKLAGNSYHFFAESDGKIHLVSAPQEISAGVWHQIIARRDGGKVEIFLDGRRIAAANVGDSTMTPSGNGLLIGRRNPQDGLSFPHARPAQRDRDLGPRPDQRRDRNTLRRRGTRRQFPPAGPRGRAACLAL